MDDAMANFNIKIEWYLEGEGALMMKKGRKMNETVGEIILEVDCNFEVE